MNADVAPPLGCVRLVFVVVVVVAFFVFIQIINQSRFWNMHVYFLWVIKIDHSKWVFVCEGNQGGNKINNTAHQWVHIWMKNGWSRWSKMIFQHNIKCGRYLLFSQAFMRKCQRMCVNAVASCAGIVDWWRVFPFHFDHRNENKNRLTIITRFRLMLN